MYITEFCRAVIELARHRVRSGEISERALARKAAISQPHLHNVFKGIRELSTEAADRLMQALGVTVPQLLWSGGGVDVSGIRAVPVLRHRIGPGSAVSFNVFRGYVPFPVRLVTPLIDPLAAYLAADLALPAEYRAGDLILLDQNQALRAVPAASSCWVVAENTGLRVRYVRRTRGALAIAGNPGLSGNWDWRPVASDGRNILEVVRARIVWIGREIETEFAEPAGQAGEGDRSESR